MSLADGIEVLFAGRDSQAAKDLKLNLKRFALESALAPDEAAVVLIASAVAADSEPLNELIPMSNQLGAVPITPAFMFVNGELNDTLPPPPGENTSGL